MPKRGKGYRQRFSRPLKGQRRWKCGACKTVNERGDFLGFDVPPISNSERHMTKNGLRVLALFDGIGTGLVALKNLGVKVDAYYSCEVDRKALEVQRLHFHREIQCLGNVSDLSKERLDALGRIDLVIGGSPCDQLSLANPRRKGLHGEASSGALFFEYHRILLELQEKGRRNGVHLFWLFENTSSMEKVVEAEICRHLGSRPIKICASSFVPMKRARYYWGNVPFMDSLQHIPQCTQSLQEYLKPGRIAAVTTIPTITTQSHSQLSGFAKTCPVLDEGKGSLLHICELELLFGYEEHYTDAANLSITDRRKLLGRAWSVDVIMDILKPLTVMFLKA